MLTWLFQPTVCSYTACIVHSMIGYYSNRSLFHYRR